MKLVRRVIVIAVMSFSCYLAFSGLLQAEQVKVALPDFPIAVNKVLLNNNQRVHPFIVYQGITYMPLTSDDCRFLGISVTQGADSSLLINSKQKAHLFFDVGENPEVIHQQSQVATQIHAPIVINGIPFNDELYPFLSLQDTIYFPLTWNLVVDILQWSYSFDIEQGLLLASRDPLLFSDDAGYAEVEIWVLKDVRDNYYAGNYSSLYKAGLVGCVTLKADFGDKELSLVYPDALDQQLASFTVIDNILFEPIHVGDTRGVTFFIDMHSKEFFNDPTYVYEKCLLQVKNPWVSLSDVENREIKSIGGIFYAPNSFTIVNSVAEDALVISSGFIYQILDSEERVIVEYPLSSVPSLLEKKSSTSINIPCWDGKDAQGRQLPNGRYIKRMLMIPFAYQLVASQATEVIEQDSFFLRGYTQTILLER